MTENVKKKLASCIVDNAWAFGEATAARAVAESDLKPFYKWNLIFVLTINAMGSLSKALDANFELIKALKHHETPPVEVPESEES